MQLGERGPRSRRLILPWLIMPLLLVSAAPAMAQEREPFGILRVVVGDVRICEDRTPASCRQASNGSEVFPTERVVTGERRGTRAILCLPTNDERCPHDTHFSIGRDTVLDLPDILDDGAEKSGWELVKGALWAIFLGEQPSGYDSVRFTVRTPTVVGCREGGRPADVRGLRATYWADLPEAPGIYEFRHDPDAGASTVAVAQGVLVCETRAGERTIKALEKLTVSPDAEATVEPMAVSEVVREVDEILGGLGDEWNRANRRPSRGSFDGTWSSTYGKELILSQSGNKVTGSYESDNGQVIFTVSGDRTLDGFWVEDASGVECGSAKEGRTFWGRLILEFDEALTEYTGTWGYCDAEPNRGWYGSRVGPG